MQDQVLLAGVITLSGTVLGPPLCIGNTISGCLQPLTGQTVSVSCTPVATGTWNLNLQDPYFSLVSAKFEPRVHFNPLAFGGLNQSTALPLGGTEIRVNQLSSSVHIFSGSPGTVGGPGSVMFHILSSSVTSSSGPNATFSSGSVNLYNVTGTYYIDALLILKNSNR